MSYHANLENEEREKERRKGGEEGEKNEGKKSCKLHTKSKTISNAIFSIPVTRYKVSRLRQRDSDGFPASRHSVLIENFFIPKLNQVFN